MVRSFALSAATGLLIGIENSLTAASMPTLDSELKEIVALIVSDIRRLMTGRDRRLLVAIDGASGSGKSTLAAMVAVHCDATLVTSDNFFAAQLTDADWDGRSPAERAADAIEWRRLRAEALEPLLAGNKARWYPFDFAGGIRPDGTYGLRSRAEIREPNPIIILEGTYSSQQELGDLIDWSVLVDAPADVRRGRLTQREDAGFLNAWHARWDAAELWYLSHVRPRSSFDRVVINVGSSLHINTHNGME